MVMLVIQPGLLNRHWKTQVSSGWNNAKCGVILTTNGSVLKHPVGPGQCGWLCFLRTTKAIAETVGQQLSWAPGVRHNFTPSFWKSETFQPLKGYCKFYIPAYTFGPGYTCGTGFSLCAIQLSWRVVCFRCIVSPGISQVIHPKPPLFFPAHCMPLRVFISQTVTFRETILAKVAAGV